MVLVRAPQLEHQLYRFLDTVGDGSGIKNAILDHSVTPQKYLFVADRRCYLYRLLVSVVDQGIFDVDTYGALPVLSNGIGITLEDDGGTPVFDVLDGLLIKNNADWIGHCFDANLADFGPGLMQALICRWVFFRAGAPLVLPEGYRLVMLLNDDFSGLDKHTFGVEGQFVDVA